MNDFQDTNDLKRTREIELSDGQKLVLKCSDPYGFWTIHYLKGEIPDFLKGNYTSFIEAEKRVQTYLAQLPPSKQKEISRVNQ
jgi:hypothetical protein